MPRRFAIGSAQDLVQAERDIRARAGDSELDFAAMAAISNIYRAANAIRNHMEQKVLAEDDLSWAAFTVLFVLWIWGDQQLDRSITAWPQDWGSTGTGWVFYTPEGGFQPGPYEVQLLVNDQVVASTSFIVR